MEGAFSNNLSMYNIMPNPEPLRYAITLKLSPELLEYLSEDPQGRLWVCFGPKQVRSRTQHLNRKAFLIISLENNVQWSKLWVTSV